MRYLMFERRFVKPIVDGTKRQTIRASSCHAPRELLSLRQWAGVPYRSKQLEIVPPVRIAAVEAISIFVLDAGLGIFVSGVQVEDVEAFARADGFPSADKMAARYRAKGRVAKTDEFSGALIRWEPIKENR